MIKKTLTILSILCLIQSCNLADEYKRREANIEKDWSKDIIDLDKKELNKIEDISWQKFFDNKELRNVIKIGLKNNHDLKIASLNIKKSKEFYNIQKSELLPTIDGEASFRRQKITRNSTNFGFSGSSIIQNQYFVGANLSYEIDLFGRINNLKDKALKEFLASKGAKQALKTSLIAEIANIYLNLAELKSRLDLSQKIVNVSGEILTLKQKSYDLGNIAKSELLEAKSNFDSAKSDHYLTILDFEKNKNQLIYLIGEKDDKNFTIVRLDELKFREKLPNNLPSEILLTRADILEKEFNLMAKNADIGAARAAFFPSISLTSGYGFASADFTSIFTSGSKGAWNFAPRIDLPIFNYGRVKANLESAKIEEKIAAQEYLKTIENGFREVSDQLVSRKNIKKQFDYLESQRKNKEEIYKISLSRLNNGIDNYFNKSEKELDLYVSEISRNLALRDFYGSEVNFYKAIGGGI